MGKPSLMVESEKLAKRIAYELVANYPGEQISKTEIRRHYNIAWVKGAVTFAILEDYGFTVLSRAVIVPSVLPEEDLTS